MMTLDTLKKQIDRLTATVDRVLLQLGAPASMPASELDDAARRVEDQTARLETALAVVEPKPPTPTPTPPIV
jgi:hypothetical protein